MISCPAGYANNDLFVCVPLTVCPPPTYLSGTVCTVDCGTGFYGNDANRVCERCISNCDVCINGNRCRQCRSDYLLDPIRGDCLLSLNCPSIQFRNSCVEECPAFTVRFDRLCVDPCITGTIFRDGYCFPI